MIDFAQISPEDFEFLCEALLRERNFWIRSRPARGPDEGKDLLATRFVTDDMGFSEEQTFLVECKNLAKSGRSVGESGVGNLMLRLTRHRANRYLLITSTVPSAKLKEQLQAFNNDAAIPYRATFWAKTDLLGYLEEHPRLRNRFFPHATNDYPTEPDGMNPRESKKSKPVSVNDRKGIVAARSFSFAVTSRAIEIRDPAGETHSFPRYLPGLSPQEGSAAIQHARYWKRVHTLTEKALPGVLRVHFYMHKYTLTDDVVDRDTALEFLDITRPNVSEFYRGLTELPLPVCDTGPVRMLARTRICFEALSYSLSWPHDSPELTHGTALADRLSHWFMRALSMADRVLESYFSELETS